MIKWISPCLSFSLSASTATTYIFIAPTCRTTEITLESYALNAEFQHFIPRFNKISSLYGYTERWVWGWKEAQRQGDFMNNLSIYTYTWLCKCVWQIFTLVRHISDLHLHKSYMPYIRLLTLTRTTLIWIVFQSIFWSFTKLWNLPSEFYPRSMVWARTSQMLLIHFGWTRTQVSSIQTVTITSLNTR